MKIKLGFSVFLTSIIILFSFSCEQSDPPVYKPKIRDSGDIIFSNYGWNIKSSSTLVGPGPNYFAKTDSNIWVDNNGFLHLKIFKQSGFWKASELICTENMGYGTYTFVTNSNLSELNENVVLGLFTWDNNSFYDQGNSEVDIEFSKWMQKNDSMLLTYSVQPVIFGNPVPYAERTYKPKFRRTYINGVCTHEFKWTSNLIVWKSYHGDKADESQKFAEWKFDLNNPARSKIEGGNSSNPFIIPAPGGTTNCRINLWLLNGVAPSNGQPVEVVIQKFTYMP